MSAVTSWLDWVVRMASQAHAAMVACPYRPGTPEHSAWMHTALKAGGLNERAEVGSTGPVQFQALPARAEQFVADRPDAQAIIIITLNEQGIGDLNVAVKDSDGISHRYLIDALRTAVMVMPELGNRSVEFRKELEQRVARRNEAAWLADEQAVAHPYVCEWCKVQGYTGGRYKTKGPLTRHVNRCHSNPANWDLTQWVPYVEERNGRVSWMGGCVPRMATAAALRLASQVHSYGKAHPKATPAEIHALTRSMLTLVASHVQ
jgi:hypothetical protein